MYWLPYSSHTSHHPPQTPCLRWISYATRKNWCSIHARCCKSSLKHSIRFCVIFPSLKHSRPDYIFEIPQQWQSCFSRMYSNCCCSCSFEPKIIKISQSSQKMYNKNILNFQESTTILNACTKKVWKLIEGTTYFLCNLSNRPLYHVPFVPIYHPPIFSLLYLLLLVCPWAFTYFWVEFSFAIFGISCFICFA